VVDRIEALGASLLVHFAVDAPPAKTAGIAAATGEHGLDEVPLIGHEGAWFAAAFEPRSGVRSGNQVDITLDTRRLHFFDPETEESVRPQMSAP
jgi:multiple sugar transport system ATP-binding protein